MLRRIILGTVTATLALTLSASIAVAGSGNPSGTGQPSTSCDNPGAIKPPGFTTAGFANAELHYANPTSQGGISSGNSHVVAQYDVACYHQGLNHG
ncbi:MAG TPA: hypothetical protein VE011_06585 [Candidatus Dormibacteraeota bacterium]|nr:hypothetical protein [Candidatus Dormibacteraeota bacterium]